VEIFCNLNLLKSGFLRMNIDLEVAGLPGRQISLLAQHASQSREDLGGSPGRISKP